MAGYITAIVDKSVLQSLSAREAEWLFHHFRVNIPPVLFSEVLADLEKTKGVLATGSGLGDVRMLASKIESHSVFLNAAHQDLIDSELLGQSIELAGRPVVGNAKSARMPDGSVALYIDQTPFQAVMDRWCAGDFDGMEREFAKMWRSDQAQIDLEGLTRDTKHLWSNDLTTPAAVAKQVDRILFGPGREYRHLDTLMQLAGARPVARAVALRRWNRRSRPAPAIFMPYTSFVARVVAVFMFGLHARVITTRATNLIDVEYFKYLPFAEVFSSSDNLHATLFPVITDGKQSYVSGTDMKAALREMANYYDALSENEKKRGSMNYADYPPVTLDNAITRLFDSRFPRWRDGANLPRPPRDTSGDAALLAEIQSRFEWVQRHAK